MVDYFLTMEKSHDDYSLSKLRSWLVDMSTRKYEEPPYPAMPTEEMIVGVQHRLMEMSTSYVCPRIPCSPIAIVQIQMSN